MDLYTYLIEYHELELMDSEIEEIVKIVKKKHYYEFEKLIADTEMRIEEYKLKRDENEHNQILYTILASRVIEAEAIIHQLKQILNNG